MQEADAGYLERVREVYLRLAAADETGWYKLDCLIAGEIRSIDEIAEEIWDVVAARRNG